MREQKGSAGRRIRVVGRRVTEQGATEDCKGQLDQTQLECLQVDGSEAMRSIDICLRIATYNVGSPVVNRPLISG